MSIAAMTTGPVIAGHLGLRDPADPLLADFAGGADLQTVLPVMAAMGFTGVFDNYLSIRDAAYIDTMALLCAAHRLRVTSFVHDVPGIASGGWVNGAALDALPVSLSLAQRLGVRHITCVTAALPDMPLAVQHQAMAGHLRKAADLAWPQGVSLGVEACHPDFAPGLLVRRLDEALAIIGAAGHPGVRLTLDLGHCALFDEDPLAVLAAAGALAGSVQLADVPGRVEPGAGMLDYAAVMDALALQGRDWVIEIECEPALPGRAGEVAMLERLTGLGLLPPG